MTCQECSTCQRELPLTAFELRNDQITPSYRKTCRKCRKKQNRLNKRGPVERAPEVLALPACLPFPPPLERGELVASLGCVVEMRRRAA